VFLKVGALYIVLMKSSLVCSRISCALVGMFAAEANMAASAHTIWQIGERTVGKLHGLLSLLHEAFVDARETRTKLEAELYRNRY
jgi:hypothetical protein